MSRYYGTQAWRRLRAECIQRQPICATPGCGKRSSHADHIVPRSKGGRDHITNLRGLCASCHNSRTARGNAEPTLHNCDADGRPIGAGHWWNT